MMHGLANPKDTNYSDQPASSNFRLTCTQPQDGYCYKYRTSHPADSNLHSHAHDNTKSHFLTTAVKTKDVWSYVLVACHNCAQNDPGVTMNHSDRATQLNFPTPGILELHCFKLQPFYKDISQHISQWLLPLLWLLSFTPVITECYSSAIHLRVSQIASQGLLEIRSVVLPGRACVLYSTGVFL